MKNTTTKIIAVFIVLVIFFIAYSERDYITSFVNGILGTGNTKIFKVVGDDIGPYLNGDYVVAEKQTYTKREPQNGEIVVYEKIVNNQTVNAVGTVTGQPGSTVKGVLAPAGYYLIQKDDKIEKVQRENIKWLVIRKAV